MEEVGGLAVLWFMWRVLRYGWMRLMLLLWPARAHRVASEAEAIRKAGTAYITSLRHRDEVQRIG